MEKEKLINIEVACPMGGIIHDIYNVLASLVERAKHRRENGEYIQDILKDYSPFDREKFISGYCDECQKKIFGYTEVE